MCKLSLKRLNTHGIPGSRKYFQLKSAPFAGTQGIGRVKTRGLNALGRNQRRDRFSFKEIHHSVGTKDDHELGFIFGKKNLCVSVDRQLFTIEQIDSEWPKRLAFDRRPEFATVLHPSFSAKAYR
jgi:hypothetical protein